MDVQGLDAQGLDVSEDPVVLLIGSPERLSADGRRWVRALVEAGRHVLLAPLDEADGEGAAVALRALLTELSSRPAVLCSAQTLAAVHPALVVTGPALVSCLIVVGAAPDAATPADLPRLDLEAEPAGEATEAALLGFLLTLICTASLEALILGSKALSLPAGAGGMLGKSLGTLCAHAFGGTGAGLLLLVLAAIGISLFTGLSWHRHATAQLHAREDELAASLKIAATGELAGTLAYELGHPLGAISNYASALNHIVREVAPNSEAPRIGAKLSAEIVRATDTLHRLRDFFRTGAMSFEPLDLVTLTKDAVALLKDRLERNGISPHIVIPSRPLMVLGDQIQLRAVIHNLMVNAVDALKPVDADARSMSITLRPHGDSAVLEVEDSGGGVAPDVKDHIFEPLVTTKKDGLGLGLSMSRSVVVAHGGSIELHDSTLGGARFTVTLPREDT